MQRAVVNISREAEENIGSILQDVRRESNASQSSLSGFSRVEETDGASGSASATDERMEWVSIRTQVHDITVVLYCHACLYCADSRVIASFPDGAINVAGWVRSVIRQIEKLFILQF